MLFNYNHLFPKLTFNLIFLVFFLLLTGYLIYLEIRLLDNLNSGQLQRSGRPISKLIKDLIIILGPVGIAYTTFIEIKLNGTKRDEQTKIVSLENTRLCQESEALRQKAEASSTESLQAKEYGKDKLTDVHSKVTVYLAKSEERNEAKEAKEQIDSLQFKKTLDPNSVTPK